ncbi:MAG: DUF4340 domain-containing protein [Candidatus Sericytochromatia bacterium]
MKPAYTFGMLALLVALGLYVFAFERGPVAPKLENGKPVVNLARFEPEQIKTLTITQKLPAGSLRLKQADGKWLFADGKAADNSRITPLLEQLKPWQAADVLEDKLDPSQAGAFGLATPDLTLKLETTSGAEVFKVGNKTPTNSGYYVQHEGDPRLFLSYVNVPENLQRLLSQPPVPSPVPAASGSP